MLITYSELGEPTGILTLHPEVSRVSNTLDDFFVTITNFHHATGILADQLVRGVMFDAEAAVENDYMRDVAAEQARRRGPGAESE